MKLLQAKLARYDAPQKAKALGVYPYFREIESDQEYPVLQAFWYLHTHGQWIRYQDQPR